MIPFTEALGRITSTPGVQLIIYQHWISGTAAEHDFLEASSYRKTSNISRTLSGSKIVDNSDVVGASPVGAAPTTSSFST